MMRAFVKLIVQGSGENWTAWFNDAPQIAMGGEWPTDAIRRLLAHFGENNFDEEGIIALDEEMRDGHLAFLPPLNELKRIPVPSLN